MLITISGIFYCAAIFLLLMCAFGISKLWQTDLVYIAAACVVAAWLTRGWSIRDAV